MSVPLKSPVVYFGGKSRVASYVWQRLGDVKNYVEPFFGSGAVLLARPDFDPTSPPLETVNDFDGMVSNFWRAVQADPQTTAHYADWPSNENDLHARHIWLVNQKESLVAKLEGDPDYYDPKIAGYWVWGMALWIGSGFCSGNGAWQSIDGELVKVAKDDPNKSQGVARQRPELRNDGMGTRGSLGVVRQLPNLKNNGSGTQQPTIANSGIDRQSLRLSGEQGVRRKGLRLSGEQGANSGVYGKRLSLQNSGRGVVRHLPHYAAVRGIARQRPHYSNNGQGVPALLENNPNGIYAWFDALSARLRRVRVASGDWSRVCGPSVTFGHGVTGIFLDPPYSEAADRQGDLYANDNLSVAHEVRQWCIENGDNPLLRIALCGYDSEHAELESHGWTVYKWSAAGGYGTQGKKTSRGKDNKHRERIWFSPFCIPDNAVKQLGLFD